MKTDDNAFNQYFVGYPVDALIDVRNEIGYVMSTSISPTINNYLGTTLWNEVYVDGVDTAEALDRRSRVYRQRSVLIRLKSLLAVAYGRHAAHEGFSLSLQPLAPLKTGRARRAGCRA